MAGFEMPGSLPFAALEEKSKQAQMSSKESKRLFLVDAMGYIFRAFYAPMDRLQTSAGVPTKVPYLFATMMRRLLKHKDLQPGLCGRGIRRLRAHVSRQAFRGVQSAAPAHAAMISLCSFRSCAGIARRCVCPSSNIPATKPTT